MRTNEKLIVTAWIVLMFYLISITFQNSFAKNYSILGQNIPALQISQESVSKRPHMKAISNVYFENTESEKEPIIYGRCRLESWDEPTEWVEQIQYEDEEVLVADPLYGKELYIFYIAQITEEYFPSVDPYIALAILETESNYKPNLKSKAGAIGLMQVIPKYHAHRVEKFGLNDLWDPYTNIICAIDLLDELYSKRGDWSKALLGYNNSASYVKYVLNKADILRKDGYFG